MAMPKLNRIVSGEEVVIFMPEVEVKKKISVSGLSPAMVVVEPPPPPPVEAMDIVPLPFVIVMFEPQGILELPTFPLRRDCSTN